MDKRKQLYNLYKERGLISDAVSEDVFLSANESQQEQLYNLGKQNELFESTDFGTFQSAWEPIKKKEESDLPLEQEDTSLATPEMEPQEPSAFSQFPKEDSEYKPFASFGPVKSKAKTVEAQKIEKEKVLEESEKGIFKDVAVNPGDLMVVQDKGVSKVRRDYEPLKSKANQLQEKYGDLGFKFDANESTYFGDDIIVTADDGTSISINTSSINENNVEDAKKLQEFLFSKSAGQKKRELTPAEMLIYSDRNKYEGFSKSKYDRIYTDDNIKKSLDFVNEKINADISGVKESQKEISELQAQIESLGESASKETLEEFNSKVKMYNSKIKDIKSSAIIADQSVKNIVAERIERDIDRGNWASATYNGFVNGAEDLAKGVVDVLYEGTDMITRPLLPMDREKKYEQEKKIKEWLTSAFDEKRARGITDAYIDSKGMALKALFSVPEFLPTLMMPGGPIARIAAMTTQGVGRRMEEYDNSPEMQKMMSREEAFLINTLKSTIEAKLENVGITQALSRSGLANSMIVKALQKWAPNMGPKALNTLANAEVNSLAAKAVLNTAGAFIVEAETGALQNIMETGINELYNVAKEKQVFEQPKVFTKEWTEGLVKDAVMEGLGGMWMGGAINVSRYTAEGVLGKRLSNEEFSIVKKMLNDGITMEAMMVDLKNQVINGNITAEESSNILNNFKKAASIVNQMPEGDLSDGQQRAAFDLINERTKLESEIAGKDPNLVSRKTKRITEINERLKLISENAVQEQTTSEVPVQPEATVGEEVAQGEPQAGPEVTTEEEIKIDVPSIVANSKSEVDTVVAADLKEETGQTFNIDGTVYSDGGLVVPVVSENLKQEELTPERIADFVEKNKGKIGSNAVKVGIYKFPNKKEVSIDLNIVVPRNNREAALEFGKIAGQESLFDLDTFENIKTGSDGKSPRNFTDEEFRRISKELEEGRVPETGQQQTLAAEQGTPTTIEGTGLRENIKKSIAKVFKSFDAKSFKNAKEMAAYAKAKFNQETGATDSARIFVGSDGKVEVLVNEELADDTAFGHEVWHALLLKAFGDNQAKFAEFRGAIDKTLRQNGYEDIADSLDEFSSQYTEEGEVPAEEYLAQLGGLMTSANIDLKNLTPAQKSLLQQIKDIINDFAIQLTGQPVFLKDATPETILDFMSTMSDMMIKGEDISGFFEGGKKTATSKTRAQKAAIEILDGPKFDNKLKEDVASYLNGLRDSEIPPNSSREQLMERFINNVYEEVGYYLFSKPDARSAGLTWYIEDMVEFENKVKVILPELSNEKQYKLFLSILAFTSSGTNPNQNLSYAYNLWNNSKDPKNFEFSKDWGDKKLSFVDKKGKAVASGVIVKETAKEYTVELVDSLGRPEVDSKGNKKYEKVSKASMKPGYPKPTGYTNRGKIIVGQLEKLEKLYADLKSIDAVVQWLETPHPIAELRKYNEAVPDVNGKGPGKTNKKYDPSKNADGERNGAFIFGEKIGSFYQNMIGIGETITMDLWWSRTWNRYMGTMINTTSGNKEIQEVPRSDRERNIMREAVKMVAEDLNLQVSELQAAIWYFEQELWTKSGNASPSYSYVTAIDELTEKLKVDEETRTKLRAAEADLTEAEKRRKNAAERAAAVVASKGGEIPRVEVKTRAQKAVPDVVDEVLTDDGKGNYVFVHYSDERRDTIKPMSGSNKGFTSKEEVSAISSVGGVAMYYTKQGQVEKGVGDVPHTVLVPKEKVYFYGTTERGKILNDPENFQAEARRRFQEYKNRNNPGKPTEFAFDSDNAAAWVGKVAEENGYDMLVTNWGGPMSYRAQSVKELTPEAEYTPFKEIPKPVFEIGDEIYITGDYAKVVSINGDYGKYEGTNMYGYPTSGSFNINRPSAIIIKKANPTTATRAQKAQPTEATETDFVLPFGKYKGQWYTTTPKAYRDFLSKQDWFDPRKYLVKTLEKADEAFGTEDGEANFISRAQKIDKKKTKEISSSIINSLTDEEIEKAKSLINNVEAPKKTTKAYKLFKVKKEFPGELFPLFVGANESVTVGEWIEAKEGEIKVDEKTGKKTVKSTLGPLAYRPGWHSGDSPMATHIGSKAKKEDKKPSFRSDDHVWAEVEVGDDFDWQKVATERAEITKQGKINVSTAHITDQVPLRGFYRYKTNPNMTGNWIISGEMKVNRVLTEKEVQEINKKSNAKDLPRVNPFNYEAYGFNNDGSVKDPKKVSANQVARAYQVAKETGENPELVKAVESKITTRAQKAQPSTIPGYDRMIVEAKGIVSKSKNRGVSAAQIAENVINYIQKSKVYERADDLQREQIIRDARKDLGLRQKSAPSVDKLLGKIKDIKKVTVSEKSVLKELLKAEAKGARTAVQARSQAAKTLNDMLKALEKKGSVTTAQVRAIMTRYSKVNFFSSSSMDNFVNYMAKVFSDAEYSDKLKTASKTANAIRRLSKNDSVQAGTKAVAKKFLEIDPRLVEDIDKYLEFAKALNDAVRTSMAVNVDGDFEVSLKKAIDYNEFQDYMEAQITAQEEYIKNQLAEIHKDLIDSGAIDASMSLADMKAIIDAINYENENSLPSEEKERMIRTYLESVMDSYAGLIDYMLENSMDPFSLELISISDKDRQIISKFMKMDLNKLPLKEAYSVVEAIENFIVNKNVDNMGSILAAYEGGIDAESMQRKGTKARPIRSFFSKKFGRVWAEQIEQLQITMERMFGGIEKATEIMRKSGVLDISQGKTKAVMQSEKIINKYTEKFGKIKDFNSAENIFERKIISFMTRTINGSDIQKSIEFERRKRIVDETITAMENGSETEVRDAAIAREVYDKVLKGAKTPQEVASKSKDFNNEAVKFWIDEFSNIFDELQSVSRSVYNTILERDINYTPDRFKRFEGIEEIIDITGSSFAANNESYDTKKSGTLMANNRIKTLGKDPKRVLSFDFDTDMSNAMLNALIDINTAYAIRKAKSFYESDSFGKMVPSKDDRELIRRRVKAFITKTKRKEYVPQSELAQSMKAVNLMSQIAVGRALGSLAQVPKQTISVVANTMVNSDGKLAFVDVINAKDFIDNSGYSIALRGIASNADVQTINKMLERQSESTAQEVQRGLNKAAEMWLNSFIARPDVWAARLSWITYYKESLRKQGIDADNIDWSTHQMNQKAGDYAQAQVNRQQNYSDSDFAGELLGSKDPMKAYTRKVLFPYMTFVFNQKSRQMADIAILSNKTSSKADKAKARRSLYGLAAEMATYSLVGYFIKEVYAMIVNALTGGDDDEEDKDKRLKNHIKYSTKTMINDLLSPIPNITDTPIDLAINKIMKVSGVDEDAFSIPEDKDKSLAEVAVGPSSIVLEGMVNLERMSYAALTGTAVGDYKGKLYERELSKENQDLMKYVTVVYTAYLVGAVPADMGRMSEQVYRKLLKNSKKGKGSSGIKTSIDTKIK